MIRFAIFLAALFAATHCVSAQTSEPLGVPLKTVFVGDDHGWQDALEDIASERAVIAQCRVSLQQCPIEKRQAAASFIKIIDDAAAQTGRARIGWLNRAINLAIRPMESGCASSRTWTASLETLAEDCGDCKEYAVAKAVGLSELGFTHVRIVVGRKPSEHEYHAIVEVWDDSEWITLDNLTDALVPAGEKPDFVPFYALKIPAADLSASN